MGTFSVGVIYKHNFEPAKQEAEKLVKWLQGQGLNVFSKEMGPSDQKDTSGNIPEMPVNDLKWIIVLGGDGTLQGA